MKNVIIVPTYNERENIKVLIPFIFKIVPDVFITVADDNSPDGTGKLVLEMQKQYPRLSLIERLKKDGLGKAYINAFSEVLKDENVYSIIMMDADLSHNPRYLPEMIEKGKRFSVVIGSRYVPSGGTMGWELWRRLLSLWANFYCRIITGIPIKDCTGGFNLINAELLRKIDFSKIGMSGYAFTMGLKYKLYKAGATFYEVPIIFTNRVGGESKFCNHILLEGIIAPWKMIIKK